MPEKSKRELKMPKRSGKFYYKNEREVMESLGLKQVPGSGNGWVAKEDGENDFILCQLKSTDAQSIRVQQVDIRKLEEHAMQSHKFPLFAIQFLNTNEVWLMAKPEDFADVANYIVTGKCEKPKESIVNVVETRPKTKKKIVSSSGARENYYKELEKKRDKTKKAN